MFSGLIYSQVWISRIKRDPTKDFKITESSKICSAHFLEEDYKFVNSQKKARKDDACPSIFSWTKNKEERTLSAKWAKLEEEREKIEKGETDTASEGERGFSNGRRRAGQ